MTESTMLFGRREIMAYMRRSWEVLLKWERDLNFPMAKIEDTWESDIRLIEIWKRGQITEKKPCQE